jgi:hypothetical protein
MTVPIGLLRINAYCRCWRQASSVDNRDTICTHADRLPAWAPAAVRCPVRNAVHPKRQLGTSRVVPLGQGQCSLSPRRRHERCKSPNPLRVLPPAQAPRRNPRRSARILAKSNSYLAVARSRRETRVPDIQFVPRESTGRTQSSVTVVRHRPRGSADRRRHGNAASVALLFADGCSSPSEQSFGRGIG